MKIKWVAVAMLSLLSPSVLAATWVNDLEVVRMSTYQEAALHFVWFSAANPECNGLTLFNHDHSGGKALFTVLTTALVSKRKVDVQFNGCDIVEVYLK